MARGRRDSRGLQRGCILSEGERETGIRALPPDDFQVLPTPTGDLFGYFRGCRVPRANMARFGTGGFDGRGVRERNPTEGR